MNELPDLKVALFSSILQAVEKHQGNKSTDFESASSRLDFAKKKRLIAHMQNVLEKAKIGENTAYVEEETLHSESHLSPRSQLKKVWTPAMSEVRMTRSNTYPGFDDSLFDMCASSWSNLKIVQDETPYFFFVSDSFIDSAPIANKLKTGREFLSSEAREKMLSEFLDDAIDKRSILLPIKDIKDDAPEG